jgi:hypothetical protein
MTEAAAAPALATTPPAPAPAVGTSDLLGAQLSPDAAREQIEARKSDKEFYKLLQEKDPAATKHWYDLHKAGYPTPQAVASVEDVNSQAAARNAEQWNNYFVWLKQQFALTPENEAELRGGVIRADLHEWAKEEKDRLVKDKGFYRKLLDGDREAKDKWERIKLMLSLRPVKPQ